ncbi:cytochrome c3 family protein [Thermodesulfobacteriota bacterium]
MLKAQKGQLKDKTMRYRWVVFFLISIGLISTAYGTALGPSQPSLNEPHRFPERECGLCHVDADEDPSNLKTIFNSKCVSCHAELKESNSHPVDISPNISIPGDMPLANGKLGCITCHYFHPFSDQYKNRSGNLLRRPGRGALFCASCHQFNRKEHIVFENIHRDSYRLSARNSRIDNYTLQCVECHDRYLDRSFGSVTEGRRSRFNALSNHPVGVSLNRVAVKKPREFNPPHALPKEIRLFNGKIGCGTCHNAFSNEKSMLVMNNWRSRLCMECHIK